MNMVWHRTHRIAVLVAAGLLLGTAQNALAGDCNSNGTDDAEDIALGTSQDCNLNGLPDECELLNNDCNHNAALDECEIDIGPMEFLAQGTFAVGEEPNAMVVADLNEDGEPDVAVTNSGGDNISILLNQGDGTLLLSSTPFVGSLPEDITAGDFDDDGDIDLAVSNFSSRSVTILLNIGFGTGLFLVGSTIDLDDNPWGVIAVDLDGDNDLDLAVVSAPIVGDSALLVWVNDGSAGFSAGAVADVGAAPRLVVSADLDGDGDQDLVVANRVSGDISVLLNNGDATFAPTVTYAVGESPLALVAADLDGDFDVDVAVANQGPDTVSVFTNDGAGNLELTQTLPVGADPKGIVAVDLDGNGFLDLATADFGFDTISILMNAGDGGYALLGSYCAGSAPGAIAAGDFGGPGAIDLVTANTNEDTVSILSNVALSDCLDCDGNRRIDSCEEEPFAFGFEADEGFRVGDIGGQQAWFRGRIVEEFLPPPDDDEQILSIACPDRQEIRFDNVDCAAATIVASSPIGTGMALRMQVDESLEQSESWAVFSPNSTTCARGIYVWEWDTYITNLDGPDFNVWIQDECETGAAAALIKYEFDGDVRFYDWFFQGFINTGFTFEPGETFSTRITINLSSGFAILEFNNDPDTISFFSAQPGSDAQEIVFENDNFFSDRDEDAAYFDNISVVALADCNGNGIDDLEDIAEGDSDDTNGDGVPDECQEDCDGNGELDPNDCNQNCVIDECDLVNGTSLDCNANGIPDLCDVIGGASEDCNGNDIPDACDIDSGSSEDTDGNGIPDECEETECEGDANGDGVVDPLDSGFVLARFGCPVGTGDEGCDTADQNGDGVVDPLDVGFVLARFGECP
ncbi:MAG: VCBS repeat-containing protein [Planctomycetes bacterium]|nr:VCBS repeat-containing protein [Planctomycetota bacterium]